MALPTENFEDDLQVSCAQGEGLVVIVARDARGFVRSPILACSPTDFLARLGGPAARPSAATF